jgi:hypothetical protein
MMIEMNNGTISLVDGEDFSRFSLLCSDAAYPSPGLTSGNIEIESENVAWIPISTVIQLRGEQATPTWISQLQGMIEKARPFGWIDDSRHCIRAHIELTKFAEN